MNTTMNKEIVNKYLKLSLNEIEDKLNDNDEILNKIWHEDTGGSWDEYCNKCQPYWDDNRALLTAKTLLTDINTIRLRPLEDWERDEEWIHIKIETFKEWCKDGFVTNYDGVGYYATENEVSNLYAPPYAFKDDYIRDDFDYVCWYNK